MKIVLNIVIAALCISVFSGCSTVNMQQGGVMPGVVFGEGTYPSMKDSETRYEFSADDFEVLGTVTGGGTSFNVLLLFSQGDNGYHELLQKARFEYPEMDALINFYWDTEYFNIGWPYPPLPVYQRATSTVTATVIRYKNKRK